jgi:alkylation response protein AidB-like acyl-CoA dehydrogenase
MLEPYRTATALEDHLGEPQDPHRAFSFARVLEADEQEVVPEEVLRLLHAWGLPEYQIPAAAGGKWQSAEQLLALLRVVARRDLTVAFTLGTNLLAALPVWMGGTPAQQHAVTGLIRSGRGLALATTERAHGSDLLANRTRAVRDGDGYRLTGEKWLISNARTGAALTVFARTAPAGGPRGFSFLLFDKDRADAADWSLLPRVRTLGLRGGDLSGIRFHNCFLPGSALVGPTGSALEALHRTLTVTRTLCAGLSLGAADTALRLVLDFARRRRLYGGTVFELPHARQVLVGAFVDGLIGDAVAVSGARAVQGGEAPVLASAVTKSFVPTLVEQLLRDLSVVLGARFYLRDSHPWALFQKVMRDAAIVSVFEGNTVVNLTLLAAQLVRQPDDGAAQPGRLGERLEAVFRLDHAQPRLDATRLRLDRHGPDLAVAGLVLASEQLDRLRTNRHESDGACLDVIAGLVERLRGQVRLWREALARNRSGWTGRAGALPPRLLALAARYCALHAAAACFQLWYHNRTTLGAFFRQGDWLVLALHRLLGDGEPFADPPAGPLESVARALAERHRRGQSFGVVPLSCGGRPEVRTPHPEAWEEGRYSPPSASPPL